MDTTTKIQLSPEEKELVQNTEWIITRHAITRKVFDMFGMLNEDYKNEAGSYRYIFPGDINYNGKISKGENYRSLPYVILDFPAFFRKESVFTIRTMFWWGNFFSITLHLSGKHKAALTTYSNEIFLLLQKFNFSVCVNEDEWEHDFDPGNYIEAISVSSDVWQNISGKNFFKISKHIPVAEWDNAYEFLLNGFREIMQVLLISYPGGKTSL